jgi:hypothetical protein
MFQQGIEAISQIVDDHFRNSMALPQDLLGLICVKVSWSKLKFGIKKKI